MNYDPRLPPRAIPTAIPVETTPTVIEQTAKRYKVMQAVGALVMIAGFSSLFISDSPQFSARMILVGMMGTLIYAAGRLLAWWYHG